VTGAPLPMRAPTTPSFRLDGRRALVAWASSGIGFGAAAALAQADAHVVLVARRQVPFYEAVAAIAGAGGKAERGALDSGDGDATPKFVASAGLFDVLVNSAGLARHAPALDTTPADYDAAMALNLRAAFFLTREIARGLIGAGKPGLPINVSSPMGHVGAPDRAFYRANKHALEGITKAIALDWAPHGIRVTTLCPTFVRTPLAEQILANPARKAWILSKIKLERVGKIADMMGPVVFLASDASAMMTGTHLLIDGGWTAE